MLSLPAILKKQILLILLAPIILTLGWPPLITGLLLFVGFVPLLLLEKEATKWVGIKLYFSLLLWNIGTTWWVWNASPEGCIAMLLANTYLMYLTFVVYRKVKKHFGLETGLFAWVVSWLAFEYLHLNWEIAYPWLNLGNGMATMPYLIQWYEYTGALGGSLWILIVNCLVFRSLNQFNKRKTMGIAAVVVLPMLISGLILWLQPLAPKGKPYSVVVVQPNIDPYLEYEMQDPMAEVTHLTKMAETKVDSLTEFLLFPETSITENCDEENIASNFSYNILTAWLKKYPRLTLVAGCNTYRFYDSTNKTSTSRKHNSGKYYDIFNSSIIITKEGVKDIYRKSKLVPGVEKMPYTGLFSFLENYAIDLGGISGSLGMDTMPRIFTSMNKVSAAPLICYESIFGEYASEFVQKGANVIFVLTNDGWWGGTPGYKHHKLYARLRAIENRREVVRCTNTGTSCVIDKKGNITGESEWWKPVTMKYTIHNETDVTFYTRFGDYIGKMAAWLFAIVFIMSIAGKHIRRKIFK